jgi:hypothetical protein
MPHYRDFRQPLQKGHVFWKALRSGSIPHIFQIFFNNLEMHNDAFGERKILTIRYTSGVCLWIERQSPCPSRDGIRNRTRIRADSQ